MTYMLTSGTVGDENKNRALRIYLDAFTKKVGVDAAKAIVNSTYHLPFAERLWELERLLTGKTKADQ